MRCFSDWIKFTFIILFLAHASLIADDKIAIAVLEFENNSGNKQLENLKFSFPHPIRKLPKILTEKANKFKRAKARQGGPSAYSSIAPLCRGLATA